MASKVEERIFLESFLEKCPDNMSLIAERESPDFRMRDRSGEFGLEVVQIFKSTGQSGSPMKAIESRRMKYLRKIALDYYQAIGLPLLVKAILPDRPDSNSSALTERLKEARPVNPWERASFTHQCGSQFHLTSLPTEAGQYKRWQCINNSVGWVGALNSKLVTEAIQAKAAKSNDYRKAFSRVALLLVADRTRGSGMLQWRTGESLPHHEGFDMIYLYIHPFEVVRIA